MFKKISILLSLFWGLVFANTIIDVSGEKTNLEINHENPEVIQINVNTAPMGATAVFTINPKGVLNAKATKLYIVMIKYVIKDSHALGT